MSKLNWATKICAVFLLWVTVALALSAQTFTKVFTFNGTNGNIPVAGLVQGTNGNLYGTTQNGGAFGNAGTVFTISPAGRLTSLYSFCAQNGCPDGENPRSTLVQAGDGNFYGTTETGGANDLCLSNSGCGVVFKISPSGKFTTLYSFCSLSNCADGVNPPAGLALGFDGNLYGTTQGGGPTAGCARGCGTVFKITLSGKLTTLHSFCAVSNCLDGVTPNAGLILGRDGNFYGTTSGGGNSSLGVVFKITPGGTLTTLYSFCTLANCTDGQDPVTAVAQASNGNFYGSTANGGATGHGTLFELTSTGALTTLYNFCSLSNCTDGQTASALIPTSDGNLYGVTEAGGVNMSEGTIFKLTPGGTYTTLYSFCPRNGCLDGVHPIGALVQDTNGALYGMASAGGVNGNGTIFKLSAGLAPFVETQTPAGKVGSAVRILGTSLTGATSVTFNGAAATFTVVSSSEISTTVPSGATTGAVKVVTPGGTLSTSVPFRVLP